MKKVAYSFPTKALSVFLLTLDTLFTSFFGAIASFAYNFGFYRLPESITSYSQALEYLKDHTWISEYQYDYLSDPFLAGRDICEFAFLNRMGAIALAAVGLVVFIALFVYLMAAAGRRGDREGIVLSPMDKIPFDITLFVAVTPIFLIFDFLLYIGGELTFILGAAVIGITLIALIILYLLYTFSARIKAGGWWKNTVTFMLLRFFWRCLRAAGQFLLRLFRAIPAVWRVTLVVAGYLLVFLCILSASYWVFDDMLNFLFLLLFLAAAAAVILGAAQMRSLHRAARELASGNLDYKVDTRRLFFDFKRHAENLNSIGDGLSAAVDQRMRSERLKTELITNVSHDIKTPLTSIVNYVDLLQKEHTPQQEQQYLDVLKRQSEKLRRLTVDLVEASKASTGNLPTELAPTNTEELINQAVAEYADRFAAGGLEPVVTLPEKTVTVLADGRHLWRVLDNLFNNTVKYAQPGTRVYIDVRRMDGMALLSVKNISRDRLNVSADELIERFVRGDESRHTEGSGLGLSIARSLTELMGGTFDISVDGDLFKAQIRLKLL